MSLRIEALGRLSDQRDLAGVAMDSDHFDVLAAATVRITDQKLLYEIAKNGQYPKSRLLATIMLTDHGLLAKLAEDSQHPETREMVSSLLGEPCGEQKGLVKTLLANDGYHKRVKAARELSDPIGIVRVVRHILKMKSATYDDFQPVYIFAMKNPAIIATLWPEIREWARHVHFDLSGNLVNCSNDCGHDDCIGCEKWLDEFPPNCKRND